MLEVRTLLTFYDISGYFWITCIYTAISSVWAGRLGLLRNRQPAVVSSRPFIISDGQKLELLHAYTVERNGSAELMVGWWYIFFRWSHRLEFNSYVLTFWTWIEENPDGTLRWRLLWWEMAGGFGPTDPRLQREVWGKMSKRPAERLRRAPGDLERSDVLQRHESIHLA